MTKTLLEQLPKIVADGKREAEQILDRLDSNYRVGLQTREMVIPSKDSNWKDLFKQTRHGHQTLDPARMNRLIYGDNLLAMAALLAGDDETPSMRGKINLIYIDPPFDSKADYRTKIEMAAGQISQKPTAIEQFAYADTWQNGTVSYLQMIIPRFVIMRELLSDSGSIYLHIDWHVGHYVKILMDDIFGKDNLINEVIWQRTGAHNDAGKFGVVHDTIFLYKKGYSHTFNPVFVPHTKDHLETRFSLIEEGSGRRFFAGPITAPGDGPPRLFRGKMLHPPRGRHWSYSQEKIDDLESDNLIYYSNTID